MRDSNGDFNEGSFLSYGKHSACVFLRIYHNNRISLNTLTHELYHLVRAVRELNFINDEETSASLMGELHEAFIIHLHYHQVTLSVAHNIGWRWYDANQSNCKKNIELNIFTHEEPKKQQTA